MTYESDNGRTIGKASNDTYKAVDKIDSATDRAAEALDEIGEQR
jgi:hypothetical protein